MYTDFYNLKEKPFNLTPSSKFLYLGDVHREALALLTYGVIERMGFILLTGEVGTGKTTIVHALLANLDKDIQYVYLSNPLFSPQDFMDYLAFSAFKKKVNFRSKADFLIQFEEFLKEQLQHQKIFILIIDEAQKLSSELLEEIRLLSNMETADEKLINIFLVGQPELNENLSRPECRPLLQRISIRYHIKALDRKETGDYILTRLKTAGAPDGSRIIPKNVIEEIFKYSHGYPRMINILADNSLLLGYSRGEKKLKPSMVRECYNDLQLEGSFFDRNTIMETPPEIEIEHVSKKGHRWRWAAVFILLILSLGFLLNTYGKSIYLQMTALLSEDNKAANNDISDIIDKEPPIKKKVISGKSDNNNLGHKVSRSNIIKEEAPEDKPDYHESEKDVSEKESGPDDKYMGGIDSEPAGYRKNSKDNSQTDKKAAEDSWEKTLIVKPGETLTELAINVYGYANDNLLNLIKEKNPEIEDVDLIETGQKIRFPRLDALEPGRIYTIHIASFTPFERAREMFNELISKGYEAYIMPVYDNEKGKIYRVTIGSFDSYQKSREYESQVLEKGLSGYAKTIRLEMR